MKIIENFFRKNKWTILSLVLTVVSIIVASPFALCAEVAVVEGSGPSATKGNAGLDTQVPGQPTTVSGAAAATGGVGGDGLIQPDIDDQIFEIGTDETVLDGIMRKAKRKVKVTGYEVDHYTIDEQKSVVETTETYTGAGAKQAAIKVPGEDSGFFQENGTYLAKGVSGYDEEGSKVLPGSELMLFCVGKDGSENPIMRAVNGPKTNSTDMYCNVPTIPSGTKLIILANACAETQKEVAPDMIVPTPTRVYLQKSIMNHIVSDYFDAQKKRIPFQNATIAEALVKEFRRKCNRTLWVGRKGKLYQDRGKMGTQTVYYTEGIRWQIKREWEHEGQWTFEDIIALAKLKFTGQNCSKEATWLMGKDLLEAIQNIDFTKHKDITMTEGEVWGFKCTKLVTVFGTFYLKHEPTLDVIEYSRCGAILDNAGIVRYYIKNEEKSSDKVDGEEAKRNSVISINALALKGTSHIWVEDKPAS